MSLDLTHYMPISITDEQLGNLFKNFGILKHYAHIWNQHEKCIKMNTNKPMFGLVVLEIACDIFMHAVFSQSKFVLKHEYCLNQAVVQYS